MKKPIIIERFKDDGEHSHYVLIKSETNELLWDEATEKETQENQSVWAFLYNSDCCESAVSAISIHKTKEGTEIAKELHKAEILKEWEDACKIDECFKNYPFDFDQWWGVKEMPLLP